MITSAVCYFCATEPGNASSLPDLGTPISITSSKGKTSNASTRLRHAYPAPCSAACFQQEGNTGGQTGKELCFASVSQDLGTGHDSV